MSLYLCNAVLHSGVIAAKCNSGYLVEGGGRRESPKTVKPPKFFRETEKPPQNSAKTVITIFQNLDVPPRFCAADDCLVIIVMT